MTVNVTSKFFVFVIGLITYGINFLTDVYNTEKAAIIIKLHVSICVGSSYAELLI